jgi:hypothetical protein
MNGNPIVLVNRVGEDLNFMADGHQHTLVPGDNYGFVDAQARFAMEQNPLMGSEDYYTLQFSSLVGVRQSVNGKLVDKTACDPISDEVLLEAMENPERFDRKASDLAPVRRVKPRFRMPKGRTGEVVGIGGENTFVSGRG